MQPTPQFGGDDIYRVLVPENTLFNPNYKAKSFNMRGQIGKCELCLFARIQVDQVKGLEIANQNIAGKLELLEIGEVVKRLLPRACKIAAPRLMLNQQFALPEQVNESLSVTELLNWLFKGRHFAALDPKDLKKFIIEGLCFTPFVVSIGPFTRKSSGANANIIPDWTHNCLPASLSKRQTEIATGFFYF